MGQIGRLIPVAGVVLLIVAIGISSLHASSMSNGAPRLECIQCHVGADKHPAGFIVEGLPKQYEPGKTYKITIRITEGPDCSGGVACGGFAVEVTGGQLIVVDSENTFLATLPTGEKMLTHTKAGSMKREWTFEWKAPEKPAPVTFKISVLAANGDGSFNGDAYAHKDITIQPSTVGGAPAPTVTATKPPASTTAATTTSVVTETTTKTVVTTTPVGTKKEHNAALAAGVAAIIFIVVVAGYLAAVRR